ncbi:Mobile element protein [Lachnospiraceae bacterium TWA4]|nr:Mobile element protein [Lachnospiraceae bacterium TWA4]
MDASGIPLAFSIHPGNTNEQTTLIPLEEQIIKDFSVSRFIVCTDAGLASKKIDNSITLEAVALLQLSPLKS